MRATAFKLIQPGVQVKLPRRVEAEPIAVHEARVAAVKRLGSKWVRHPAYRFDPRHSNNPEVYGPARAAYLACIAKAAAADRARNPAFRRAEELRAVLGAA